MSQDTQLDGFSTEPRGASKTLAETAYWRFRADILSGELAPNYALKSVELQLKYELGISPLREALSRLIGERLVIATGQKGFRVAPLTVEDVEDTLQTRLLIETAALRRSIEAADVEWETGVVSSLHRLSRQPVPTGSGVEADIWGSYHRDFHRALLAGCGSERLKNIASSLIDHAERHRRVAIRTLYSLDPNVRKDGMNEHYLLMEAALKGQADEAAAILEQHYRTTASAVIRSLRGEMAAEQTEPVLSQ